MELPKQKIPASRKNPRLLTIFGQSKVGKTTKLATLDNCLILDTENGTDTIDALKVNINSLKQLSEVYKLLLENKKEGEYYKYIALDTIDNLVGWIERAVCKRAGVNNLIDIAYGAGYNDVRLETMSWINRLKRVSPHIIVCGHRKKTIVDSDDSDAVQVTTSSLELSGKLKNLIMADSDAIGYVFRTTPEEIEGETPQERAARSEIKISFVANDELEAGARQEHLRGNILPFEWDKIYID